METRLIEYEHAGVLLEGLLATRGSGADGADGADPKPGVLVAHAWAGRGDNEAAAARRLAELGYAAFALDLFGKDVRGANRAENAALIRPFLADRPMLQARMAAAVSVLQQQPEVDADNIAAIGFCFGGLCVLDLARSGAAVRGVVSLHGLFTPPDPPPDKPITASVLALTGSDDPMVPVTAVNALQQELSAAGADWQIHVYGGTMHAFTNPLANDPEFGTVYQAVADRRAWRSTIDFLAEVLV